MDLDRGGDRLVGGGRVAHQVEGLLAGRAERGQERLQGPLGRTVEPVGGVPGPERPAQAHGGPALGVRAGGVADVGDDHDRGRGARVGGDQLGGALVRGEPSGQETQPHDQRAGLAPAQRRAGEGVRDRRCPGRDRHVLAVQRGLDGAVEGGEAEAGGGDGGRARGQAPRAAWPSSAPGRRAGCRPPGCGRRPGSRPPPPVPVAGPAPHRPAAPGPIRSSARTRRPPPPRTPGPRAGRSRPAGGGRAGRARPPAGRRPGEGGTRRHSRRSGWRSRPRRACRGAGPGSPRARGGG